MEQKISLYSDVNKICELEQFMKDIFKVENLNRKIFCKIYLAVHEAVNNAIIHGNQGQTEKKVHISFYKTQEQFIFEVKDEGEGFNISKIPDPTNSNNILKESGRGLFIMNKYADRVVYNSKGNQVQLIFNNL